MAEGLHALVAFAEAHQASCCIESVGYVYAPTEGVLLARCPRCLEIAEAVPTAADYQAAVEHFERVMPALAVESLDTEFGQQIAVAVLRILGEGQLPTSH